MKWISVKDRLPEKEGQYLCYIEAFKDIENCEGWYNYIDLIMFDKKVINIEYFEYRIVHILSTKMDFLVNTNSYISKCVTHWMPLPEPPEEE